MITPAAPFFGTIVERFGRTDILYEIRPDIGANPSPIYGIVPGEHAAIPKGARVRCAVGPPRGVPGFVENLVTITHWRVNPASK